MNLTHEQQLIVDHIKSYPSLPTLVNSVAGSGKTTLLTAIANTLQPTRALYLAYNKSIATEASRKFPKSVLCSTIHSFAYRSVVSEYGLTIGNITYRDFPSSIPYTYRLELSELLRAFFLSRFTDFTEFSTHEQLTEFEHTTILDIISRIESKDLPCTHDYYLKFFHILLQKGLIEYEPFDFIALDEAGDVNPVTLAIVQLLPAKTKILVGDSRQNIYAFNHTINCFSVAQGTHFNMSQSFRVSPSIASDVQTFCHNYIDPSMTFVGTPQTHTISTKAFIARTNAFLISKMMELNELNTPYTLVRSADDIFKLSRTLCSLSPATKYVPPEYNYLMDDINDYYTDYDIRLQYKTILSYLAHIYKDDLVLSTTIRLILRYRKDGITKCYEEAKRHEKLKTTLLLGTAHSFKGLEVDEVYIADDLNSATASIQTNMYINNLKYSDLSPEDQGELNLYYVACTRARISLLNATQLLYTPKGDYHNELFDL